MNEADKIPDVAIPRWLGAFTQIHVFCDASKRAYAAVAYVYLDDGVTSTFLCSKSRVAPMHPVSIPRLELLAAVLASKLLSFIQCELGIKPQQCYLWTDSLVVYHWIKSESRQWKMFVANRVQTIHELTDPAQWGYVPGVTNPADIVSRGESLANLSLTVHGFQR